MNANVIGKTRDLIETHGWCQGQGMTPDGRMCLARALALASQETDDILMGPAWTPAYVAIHEAATRLYPDRSPDNSHTLVDFNDHPDTTSEDVVLVLKHAAMA